MRYSLLGDLSRFFGAIYPTLLVIGVIVGIAGAVLAGANRLRGGGRSIAGPIVCLGVLLAIVPAATNSILKRLAGPPNTASTIQDAGAHISCGVLTALAVAGVVSAAAIVVLICLRRRVRRPDPAP